MADFAVDTIAALATAPGPAAVAVVRISGVGALDVVGRIAPTLALPLEARRATLVRIRHPETGVFVDEGLLTWFPAPASYTGEDVVEFSGHGGHLAPRLMLEAVLAAGARLAERGEFTRRAYLLGKIDLVQAEAVGSLIEGSNRALHRESLRQLDRHLSRRVSQLRDAIVELEALLACHIDFPDEDSPPVEIPVLAARTWELAAVLDGLAETAPEGERLRTGALVVLAGRPNAGKSSLYNALLGEERALVTEVPGTTRDALEAQIEVGGYPVRLVDTAGLHDTDGVVERLGIEVARRFVSSADLVLFCVPVDEDVAEAQREWLESAGAYLVVRTKADQRQGPDSSRGAEADEVEVSVMTGEGLGALRAALAGRVFGTLRSRPDDAPVLIRERQRRAVECAAAEVRAFATALDEGVPAEFAVIHLKSAETSLEDVVGLVDSEAVLDELFRSFCIGK